MVYFLIWPLSHNIESWTIIPKRTISHEGRERLLNAKRCKFRKKRNTLRAHTLLFFLSSKKHRLKPQNLSRFQKESTGRAFKSAHIFLHSQKECTGPEKLQPISIFSSIAQSHFSDTSKCKHPEYKTDAKAIGTIFLMFFITPSAQKAHQSLDSSTYIRNCYCWHKKLFK